MSMPSGSPPPFPPLLQYPHAPQISPENLQQIQTAKRGLRRIRRAVSTAKFDGWTVAIFGVLTFLFALGDIVGMALGAALVVIGGIELYAAQRLTKLDGSAPKLLMWNQIALGGVLFLYGLGRTLYLLHNPAAAAMPSDLRADLETAGFGQLANLERNLNLAVYGCLMAVGVFGQGSMALYYFTRRKLLKAYIAETPPWITQMQQAGVSI
jgi:hypothetical protein